MPKNRSHIDSINAADSPIENNRMKRPQASGNSNRRFKQNPHNKGGNDTINSIEHNQSVIESLNQSQLQAAGRRNDNKSQNRSAKD